MEVRGHACSNSTAVEPPKSTTTVEPPKSTKKEASAQTSTGAGPSVLSRKTAFRFHANNSQHPREHDDVYRTVTLHTDGTFTDFNEHLWDLCEQWVTEGVHCVVYAGTYTLEAPHIQLCYDRIISRVTDVVMAKESLAADEPLKEPVTTSGTLSADGNSLAVNPFGGAGPQTLVSNTGPHKAYGGPYS